MSALSQFKNYVAEQYKAMLGLNLTEGTLANAPLVWLNDGNSAWLLDDEIGLAMRIVPFTDEQDDLNAAIQHAIRTASQLQPRYTANATDTDKHGIWQVGICWMVDSGLSESWRKAIAGIRRESGFSEEIGLDAVLAEDGENISTACERQGLPQLLLHTRRTFRITWSAMPNWLSANSKVAEMLKVFPNQFSSDIEAYKLAQELVVDVFPDEVPDTAQPDTEADKEPLKEIEIKNFRNIKQCKLSFWNPEKPAQAHVIFGPNGTGKTSLFEALYGCWGHVKYSLRLPRRSGHRSQKT